MLDGRDRGCGVGWHRLRAVRGTSGRLEDVGHRVGELFCLGTLWRMQGRELGLLRSVLLGVGSAHGSWVGERLIEGERGRSVRRKRRILRGSVVVVNGTEARHV